LLRANEEQLREAHERAVWLARFPNENPNPVARVSAGGIILYRNLTAAKLSGWAFEVGQQLPDALLPLIELALSERQGVDRDIQLAGRNYSITAMPFPTEQYVNLYGLDITKRKQAETALVKSERRFRIALTNPALAVFSTDCELRYTWFYSAAIGSHTEGFIGKRDDEILSKEDAVELMELKQQAIETQATVRGEILLHTGVRSLNLMVAVEPYFDQAGCLEGVIGAVFDMTEQRRLEAESFDHLTQMEVHHRLLEYREKERQGIARDLHDGPVQELSGLIFTLHILQEANQDPALKAEFAQIGATLKQTIQDLRCMINELRPPTLISFGVTKAIRHYIEDFQEKHRELKINLDLQPPDNDTRLSEQVNLTLFRIFQEALNNILKHARATTIWVRFRLLKDYVILEVRDNGMGFPVSVDIYKHTQDNHFGLAGMKERADTVDGEFTLTSEPGKGTTIHVTIPLVG
jgi:signal transduction histidine kinase